MTDHSSSNLEYRKFTVAVEVEGTELPCYRVCLDKKAKNVSCWIASEEAKNFSVTINKYMVQYSIHATLYCDGKEVDDNFWRERESGFIRFDATQTSKGNEKPFMFAPLEVTDDEQHLDAALLSNNSAEKFGEITVEIRRAIGVKYPKSNAYDKDSDDDSNNDSAHKFLEARKVHEQSKKATAGLHQIVYGEERKRENSGHYITYENIKELIASFTFRYRPLEVLRTCGIVPREPIPPRENSPDHRALSPTENTLPLLQSQEEDPDDDIYVPLVVLAHTQTTEASSSMLNGTTSKTKLDLDEKKHELCSDDEYSDENDDELKALEARREKLLEEKRKRREAKQGSRKKPKLERVEPVMFFAPGEIQRVIDLT